MDYLLSREINLNREPHMSSRVTVDPGKLHLELGSFHQWDKFQKMMP